MDYMTENGMQALTDLNTKILEFAKLYFKDENYDIEHMEQTFAEAGRIEPWHDLYGIKLVNISYAEDGIINNTYKKNGPNYNPEIGNINNGEDYEASELNRYNLYIPYTAIDKNKKYNGIFLFIHGGSRYKEDMEYLCSRYAKMGYITATLDYTEINENNNHTNFFRYFDEFTACITNIKQKLKEEYGFDENKLELAIGGHSLGARLSMIYGYSRRKENTVIPIKFIINQAGSLDYDVNYFYKVTTYNVTLSNIEPESIDEGIKNGTLTSFLNDYTILTIYNSYLGYKYNQSQIMQMLDNNKNINYESELYKEFYNSAKYCYGSYYINESAKNGESIIPLLSEYAGNDVRAGVAYYKFIKNLSEEYDFPIDLIYMRYGEHSLMDYKTENGMQALRNFNSKIVNFAKTFFTSDEN